MFVCARVYKLLMKRKETNFAQTSHLKTHTSNQKEEDGKSRRRRRRWVCVRWFVSHAQTRDALERVFFVDDDDIIIVLLDDVVLRSRNNYSR